MPEPAFNMNPMRFLRHNLNPGLLVCVLLSVGLLIPCLTSSCLGKSSKDQPSVNQSMDSCENDSSLIIDEFRSRFESSKYLCLISYSNECPVAKNYIKTLKDLYLSYGDRIVFCLLDPGTGSKTIRGMESCYFNDHTGIICRRYHISVYPQAVLVDCPAREMLYQGKIDDRAISLGVVTKAAQQHYLRDAIKQLLKTGQVSVKNTHAVGCFVQDFSSEPKL